MQDKHKIGKVYTVPKPRVDNAKDIRENERIQILLQGKKRGEVR